MKLKLSMRSIVVALLLAVVAIAVGIELSMYYFGSYWESMGTSEYSYGNWPAVIAVVALFTIFILAFLKPFEKRNWRDLGITEAYLVALFTEMFGIPLTIYILTSWVGFGIGFSTLEGHLWATMLDRLGVMRLADGVALVMGISLVMIAIGISMMALGWKMVYGSKGQLVTWGIYEYMRHPQYTGFILVVVAFLLQWPTIITAAMFPILLYMYYRLAKKEERHLLERFGKEYEEYMRRVPMFIPRLGRVPRPSP